MKSKVILGFALVVIGLMGMAILIPLFSMSGYRDGYWPMGGPGMMSDRGAPQYSNGLLITMDQAKYIAEQYPSSLNNPDLAVKEIMEFDNNFYIIFYEKSTGIGAFEMLIWKKDPGGMMGRGGMMDSGMMGWGGMGFAWIWIVIFLIILIVGAYLVISSFKREKIEPSGQAKPIEILKERYAKGEITAEEFERMKKELAD